MSQVSPMPWEPLPARHPTATTTSRPTIWNRIRKFTRRSVQIGIGDDPVTNTSSTRPANSHREDVLARRAISPAPRRSYRRLQSMSMNLAPRRTDTSVQRISMNLAPRRSDSPRNSTALPNYTQRACALADKEFEDDEVKSAQEIFEELLDTPCGRDFVNLQAAVLRARKRGTSRIEMQRASLDVPWGVHFFKPSQLKALGWTSDQYLIVQKLQSADASAKVAPPAVQAGLTVGDVIIGLNGEKIKDYATFITQVKSSCRLSLLLVRPGSNPMEDDEDDEDLENAEEYLMQRVLGQARKQVQLSLSRMRRMHSNERIQHLDQCV